MFNAMLHLLLVSLLMVKLSSGQSETNPCVTFSFPFRNVWLISERAPPTLDVSSFTNISSQNDAPTFSTLHYHLDTTFNGSSLSKRDTARPQDQCTAGGMRGWTFTASTCEHARNLQAVRVFCRDPNDADHEDSALQSCALNELCIDTDGPTAGHKAYCVRFERYAKVPAVRGRHTTSVMRGIPAGAGVTQPFQANALISDFTRRHGLGGASPLKLEALELVSNVAKRAIFATRVLETAQCSHCFSVKIQPLPLGTDWLRATVEIVDAVEGYLYLTTISWPVDIWKETDKDGQSY